MAVLMPLYYRMGLTSIYGYFESRFGPKAYHTGAAFFICRDYRGSFSAFSRGAGAKGSSQLLGGVLRRRID